MKLWRTAVCATVEDSEAVEDSEGSMTYEGTLGSAIGQTDKGKHVLDIPSSPVEGRMARGSAAAGP